MEFVKIQQQKNGWVVWAKIQKWTVNKIKLGVKRKRAKFNILLLSMLQDKQIKKQTNEEKRNEENGSSKISQPKGLKIISSKKKQKKKHEESGSMG